MSQGLYLGREVDAATGQPGPRVLLDPADLLTHGLIVGMTGSGKTGLAIDLIEEVLRQGIPVLAIDPKGDLGNLLLLFDDLQPASFAPWVDTEAAQREGQDVNAAAAAAAAAWTKGLADWGLSAADVAALRRSHDAVLYTPGSSAGVGLNVLQSLDAPGVPFESAEEDLRDEIAGIVSGLLALLHIDADPMRSRESILLSNLIESAWREGRGLSLEQLIPAVADPPFAKLGALPVDSVYPRKDRQDLMMGLNNLLASPAFEAWREGEPMDIGRMLRAPDGRPRLSVVYTAHLSDEERLFVTALLLDKVKTWMRRQGGTTALRALVYMDEIYGYFPPTANPPTKRPLLTLLKQARAQGVGVVLATQNPVDLDYKGLANMGLWMVGKLQTRQDRDRLAEGLRDAAPDAPDVEKLLDATRKRVFLMHDVHRKAPCLLESRWAMSYLRGPLTRNEIARLAHPAGAVAPGQAPRTARASAPSSGPPVLPPGLEALHLSRDGTTTADPWLLVKYAVRYKGGAETVGVRAWPLVGSTAAEALEEDPITVDESALVKTAPAGLQYAELPEWLGASGARDIEKALRDRLPDKLAITTWTDPTTRAVSAPGETREQFVARLQGAAGGPAGERMRDALARKRRDLEARQQDLSGRRTEKWAALGTAVLANIGLFTGRRRTIAGAGSVLSKNRMENTAEARVAGLRAEIAEIEQELQQLSSVDPARLQEETLVPMKTGVKLLRYDVLWVR